MNLKINHRKGIANIKYFNKFTLSLRFDSIADNFGFAFYFDPTNREHAELACVSHFHEAVLEHNGETLISGFIINQGFKSGAKKEMAQFGGYSKPGVLGDCDIATKNYPLQFDGMTLKQITEKLIAPFRLKLIIEDIAKDASITGPTVKEKADKKIKTTTAAESQNVADFIIEAATHQNIVVSHDEKGNLLFTKAKTKQTPLFIFDKRNGPIPGFEFSLDFNGQSIHSEITVIKQADSDGGNAGEYTIKNPYCPVRYVYRPRVIVINTGDDITIQQAAENEVRKELKNIKLQIKTSRWDKDGKIIRPNNIVKIYDPELFLYKTTEWFIESIDFDGDETKTEAIINCVPIEVYSDQAIKNMFVEVHEDLPRFK